VAEREMRSRTADEVAGCADRVGSAVELVGRPVRATYEYVRASFGMVSPAGRSEGLYLLIAKSARRPGGALGEARSSCADIAVLPFHDDLQDRRARCVEVLEAQRTVLAAVALDGQRVGEWLDAPRTC
jgi:hypothetical protein